LRCNVLRFFPAINSSVSIPDALRLLAVFFVVDFLTTGFLVVDFLTTGFLVVDFLTTGFLVVIF
jgi:hypothetical protein